MIQASLLWHKKFRKDLESIGFKFNPYDPCVANRKVQGKQHTVLFHVDDGKSSCKIKKVNDDFLDWLNETYGGYGDVKATRGKVHEFLAMTLDFRTKGVVKINMVDYCEKMLKEFGYDIGDPVDNPATPDLFHKGDGEPLDAEKREQFHTTVAQGLFVCKRARPDIHPTIAVLCTRVREPNQSDWKKLIQLLRFLKGSVRDVLTLSAENLRVIKWYIDSAFGVHPDFKSHTGGYMTFGSGAVQSISRKQKLNTKSSTEAELVGDDDGSTMMLWTKLFMEAQGYGIDKNILYQDNKSTMLLLNNGKRSSTKRTRHFNIRYFFLTDQIEKGNLCTEYCPTDEMTADYMSKPLQGQPFHKFRAEIMGFKKPKKDRRG